MTAESLLGSIWLCYLEKKTPDKTRKNTTAEGGNSAASGPSQEINPQITDNQGNLDTGKDMTMDSTLNSESRFLKDYKNYKNAFLGEMQAEKRLQQKIQLALKQDNDRREAEHHKILTVMMEQNAKLTESLDAEKKMRQEFEKSSKRHVKS